VVLLPIAMSTVAGFIFPDAHFCLFCEKINYCKISKQYYKKTAIASDTKHFFLCRIE